MTADINNKTGEPIEVKTTMSPKFIKEHSTITQRSFGPQQPKKYDMVYRITRRRQ